MDKIVFYWKFSPNNSLTSKELKDGNNNKSRITANFYYNANRLYKLNIFFITKALRPYTFKDIKQIETLGCQ
jgi:hypothetical protein